jgi:hypothetical protein
MFRIMAACLAACIVLELLCPAARATAQAAEPFPVVAIEKRVQHRHTWAYLTLGTGAGLIGASFTFARRADEAYAEYVASTDVAALDALYDRAVRNDHLSQASLLTGEALIAAGLYMRFIRRPAAGRFSLSVLPSRCVVSCRF